jgi:hypothetical protein
MNMEITPTKAFRIGFFVSLFLAGFYLALFILSLSGAGPGAANVNEFNVYGQGTSQIRNDMPSASDFASAENSDIIYQSKYEWGKEMPTAFTSSFLISTSTSDGTWRNAYRVKSAGAGHKVSFEATKISGTAEFASEIRLEATEASGENYDSKIKFDTRDGNATIEGRVYNSVNGRPATVSELSAVGKYLLEHHLNVSEPEITPEDWLGFCERVNRDMILDPSLAGIWIAPLNTSEHNYVYDPKSGKIAMLKNTTN